MPDESRNPTSPTVDPIPTPATAPTTQVIVDPIPVAPTVVEPAPAPVEPPKVDPTRLQREQREARKNVGVGDTEVAKAVKRLANQRIDRAGDVIGDYAKTNISPKLHRVTDEMKAAGWKRVGLAVVVVAVVLLFASLLGLGR